MQIPFDFAQGRLSLGEKADPSLDEKADPSLGLPHAIRLHGAPSAPMLRMIGGIVRSSQFTDADTDPSLDEKADPSLGEKADPSLGLPHAIRLHGAPSAPMLRMTGGLGMWPQACRCLG
jgi:hypothetical protein